MTTRTVLAVLAWLIFALPVHAEQDYDTLFEQSLQAIDFDFDDEWAYTETSVIDGRAWVGRYDPRRPLPERWSLLSVDGRAPTDDELEEFLDRREEREESTDDRVVGDLVEPDTVRLIEETDDYWLLAFKPGKDEENFMENVESTLRIRKPDGYLEFIDIHNLGTITPAFGVRISRLITRFTFGPATDGGPIVPLTSQVEVSGSAYLFISFDEQRLSRNSDFVHVAGGSTAAPGL